jgi:hypothetical protein
MTAAAALLIILQTRKNNRFISDVRLTDIFLIKWYRVMHD